MRTTLLLAISLALWLGAGPLRRSQFTDVAREAGVTPVTRSGGADKRFIVEGNGSGCAWLDFDGDGWSDLFIVGGMDPGNLFENRRDGSRFPNYLFRNLGNGTFQDATDHAGVGGFGLGNGVAAADYDNDGDVDLFVTNYGDDTLYRNEGDGTFSDATATAGVGGGRLWSTGASFGDYDMDGWLDLYVARYLQFDFANPPRQGQYCNYRGISVMCGPLGLPPAPDALYRNNGDGTFREVTREAGLAGTPRYGFSAVFEDFDRDGLPDILVTNDSGPNLLFENTGEGSFEEVGLVSGIAYTAEGRAQANMGLALGDVNGDGFEDVFVTTFSDDHYSLYLSQNGPIFAESSAAAGLATATSPFLGWATFFFDFDNDGRLDLFMANGHLYPEATQMAGAGYLQRDLLFRGVDGGRFEDVGESSGFSSIPAKSSRGAAFSDYDNDGDLDLAVLAIDDRPSLWRNNGNAKGNWIQLRLLTRAGAPCIGAVATLKTTTRTQRQTVRSGSNYLSQNDYRLHFGLGSSSRVDRLEIVWPGDRRQRVENVPANQIVTFREP